MKRNFRVFIVFLVCFVFLTASTPIITANNNNNSSSKSIRSVSVDKHVYYVSPQGNNKNNGDSLDKPFKTIKKAVETCKNGDEIRLMDGEYNENKITIGKSITITGLNRDKVNIKTEIDDDFSVTIQNCTFKGNKNKHIVNHRLLTVINCVFNGNKVDEHVGGAIYNVGDLTVENCSFSGNKAVWYAGGAIYNTNTATIKNCKFNNNYANECGGAIYNNGYLTVENCKFNNNYADYNGGAIYNNGYLTVENCAVNYNRAHDEGGAIYSKDSLTVKHSIFKENIGKHGGAVIMSGKNNNNIQNSNFENNQAKKDSQGGAVYICKDTEASINYCNFIGNTAMHGPAFYIRKNSNVNLSHNYWQSINGEVITNPSSLMDVSTKATVIWEPVLTQPIPFKYL